MVQMTSITHMVKRKTHFNPNTLLIHSHTHMRTLRYMHLLTHTHIQSEYCLPHRGCEGDVSATRTISILITLTPRTASTHIRPLLHYVPLLPPSIPHPFSTLLFSLVSVWVSQSASSSSCWYMLAALTLSQTHTQVRTHSCACKRANVLSTHAAINSPFTHTPPPVHP